VDCEYLKKFILYITHNADPNHRRKMPATQNNLKKAVDQWLDEANKEKRKYFFLKMEGLQAAMKKKMVCCGGVNALKQTKK
jgi:hypothetical protein